MSIFKKFSEILESSSNNVFKDVLKMNFKNALKLYNGDFNKLVKDLSPDIHNIICNNKIIIESPEKTKHLSKYSIGIKYEDFIKIRTVTKYDKLEDVFNKILSTITNDILIAF